MNKRLGYLAVYAYTDFIIGLISSTPGPMIPFLAAQQHIPATGFFFVFISRTTGAVLGALVYKIIEGKSCMTAYHKVLGIIMALLLMTLILFDLSYTPLAAGLFLGLYAGIIFFFGVSMSCCLLTVPRPDQIFFWFSMTNGSWGIGSVIAPLLVDLFTLHAFTAIGVLVFPTIIFYLFVFKSVEQIKEEKVRQLQAQGLPVTEANHNYKQIPFHLAVFIAINLFLPGGLEGINGGWIATYANSSGFATKKQAAFFVAAFWGTFTVTRFVSGFIQASISTKLKRLTQLGLISAVISTIFAYLNLQLLATSFCAVFQGVSISGVYPLTMSISSEYGFRLTQKQISWVMIVMMLCQAVMVAPTGYLMQSIYLKVFFISLVFFHFLLAANSRYVIALLQNEAQKEKERGEPVEEKQKQEGIQIELAHE